MKKTLSYINQVLILFIIGLIIRLILSIDIPGIIHPDEHYQGLEVAHFLVYGYGELTWEWRVSDFSPIRSILFPLQLAIVMKLGILFGLNYDLILLLTRTSTAFISSMLIPLMILFTYLFTDQKLLPNHQRFVSLLAGFMVTFDPILLRYSWHTFTNVYVLPIFVGGLILLMKDFEIKKKNVIGKTVGGLLFAYSIILRPEMILFYIIFFILFPKLILKRTALVFFGAFFSGLIINSIINALYFNIVPFQTLINFITFQSTGSEFFGTSPPGTYTSSYILSNLMVLVLILFGLIQIILILSFLLIRKIFNIRKAYSRNLVPFIMFFLKIYLFLFFLLIIWELIPHKEERFLLPWYVIILVQTSLSLIIIRIITEIAANYYIKTIFQQKFVFTYNLLVKNLGFCAILILILLNSSIIFLNTDITPYQELELAVQQVGNQTDLTGLVVVFPRPHYFGTMAYLHQPDIPVLRINYLPIFANYSLNFPVVYNYLIISTEYYSEFPFIQKELFDYGFQVFSTFTDESFNFSVDVWKIKEN